MKDFPSDDSLEFLKKKNNQTIEIDALEIFKNDK